MCTYISEFAFVVISDENLVRELSNVTTDFDVCSFVRKTNPFLTHSEFRSADFKPGPFRIRSASEKQGSGFEFDL